MLTSMDVEPHPPRYTNLIIIRCDIAPGRVHAYMDSSHQRSLAMEYLYLHPRDAECAHIQQRIKELTEQIDAIDDEILFYQDRMTAVHNTNEFFRVLHRIDGLTREENHLYNELDYEKQRFYERRATSELSPYQSPPTDRSFTDR